LPDTPPCVIDDLCDPPLLKAVLRDFQENPKAAQKHLSSPEIMAKLNKLVAAGIIQVLNTYIIYSWLSVIKSTKPFNKYS
jgi:hypothetical protein